MVAGAANDGQYQRGDHEPDSRRAARRASFRPGLVRA